MLDDVSRVKYEVEKCIHIAKSHPVGPVWIECPIDIQGASFDPDDFAGFHAEQGTGASPAIRAQVELVKEALKSSRRPFLLFGAGVRQSGAQEAARELALSANIPVLTSRLGMDLIEDDHPLFVGRPGTYGDRAANYTIQNADLMLVIGCRLSVGLIGYDYQNFAPHARKIIVDIDPKELAKPSIIPDIAIQADAGEFIQLLQQTLGKFRFANQKWVDQTREWKHRYPVDLPEYLKEKEGINSYHFMSVFSGKMAEGDLFLLDTGSCFHVHAQAFRVKRGQRHIITGGLSTMGYMPGAIGVAAASAGKDVYCITGDGSIQMNLQELQTIVHNKLPVKIIVLNNNGYLLIRHSQNNFMEGRLIGESPSTGVSFPDMKKIAKAYGINHIRISRLGELDAQLDKLKSLEGPVICEVITPSRQMLIPRVASKKRDDGSMVSMPYDDMFPFLPREEHERNQVYDTV
jgi:acetolactate synthase-1/2/3 large subunit